MRNAASKALLGAIALLVFFASVAAAQPAQRNPVLVPPSQFGISSPVRDMEPGERPGSQASFVKPLHSLPRPQHPLVVDPVVQSTFATALAPATSNNFPGLGNGFPGFSVNGAPSDANLAVGPNHIVQGVNTSFAVFSKTGSTITGPVAFSTLFSGSSDCTRTYYSDPIILYDRQADRWVLSILGFDSTSTGPFYHCIAVSTTGDPTGSYALYSFKSSTNLPDYPKMAVWPDAYYVTYNMYSGNTLLSAQVCAHDRTAMLAGQPEPTAQCFMTSSKYDVGLLPANLDGSTPPPAGAPNYLVSLGSAANSLSLWSFHVDWTTPANSVFTGPTSLAVAAFNDACSNGGTCIPQYGTSTQLDSLGDRIMYSLAYRNFGDHESLVTNHSVNAGSETGMRWYEIRSPGSNPIVYQQGTYAPDANHRWMGSVAMDSAGDIGAGFSVSSSSIHPEIHYTGRLSTDPLGTLAQGEASIVDGAGSQTTTICFPFIPCALTRWGDYTAMQVDPSDDCTFWYTNQYIPSNGAFNWSTRLASFKFPTCGANLVASTTTLTAIPASTSTYGTSVQFTATVSGSSGAPTGTVTFIDGNRTLASQPLNSSGTSTLSTPALAVGSHQITASYSGDSTYSGSNSSALTYMVTPAGTTTTLTSSNPNSTQGQSVTFTATVTSATSGTPTGNVTFLDSSTSLGSAAVSGGVAKLSTSSLAAGSHTITAQYNGDSNFTGSTSSSITQNVAATPQGFTLSVSPSSASVRAGKTASFTVTVTPSGGFTGSVTLSAAGIAPSPTFSPALVSITSGSNSSAMKVTTTSSERGQTYTITVTGTSGSLSNSAPSPQVTVQVH
jgi:hypothetical protein